MPGGGHGGEDLWDYLPYLYLEWMAVPYEALAKYGAGNGIRTRDLCLGKATLYQLSYSRSAEIYLH